MTHNWTTEHLYVYTLENPCRTQNLTQADRHLLEQGERLYIMGGTCFGRFLRLVSKSYEYYLFVVAGHKAWYGRGEQKYYPKQYVLVHMLNSDDGSCEYITFDVVSKKALPHHTTIPTKLNIQKRKGKS